MVANADVFLRAVAKEAGCADQTPVYAVGSIRQFGRINSQTTAHHGLQHSTFNSQQSTI